MLPPSSNVLQVSDKGRLETFFADDRRFMIDPGVRRKESAEDRMRQDQGNLGQGAGHKAAAALNRLDLERAIAASTAPLSGTLPLPASATARRDHPSKRSIPSTKRTAVPTFIWLALRLFKTGWTVGIRAARRHRALLIYYISDRIGVTIDVGHR